MDLADFRHEMDRIIRQTLALLTRAVEPYQHVELTPQRWDGLVDSIFPVVEFYREEAAEVGREFYDYERDIHVGSHHDAYLAEYELPWFREAMQPARNAFSKKDASDQALTGLLSRAEKEIENGARRTIMRAVRSDPVVKGWARVATGRETCAFCLMLVSRGPVYFSAEEAGLNLDDTSAQQIFHEVQATGDESLMKSLMSRWHPNCDCMVVPVYDKQDWPGHDAYLDALQLWNDSTAGYSGKDAVNALRRAIAHNEVSPGDLAVAA